TLHNFRSALRRHDAGPEAMSGIRCNCQDLLLIAVQGKSIKSQLLIPESLVELLEQLRRLRAQFAGAVRLVEGVEYLRHPQPGVIDIALQFAEGFRSIHQRTIRIDYTVAPEYLHAMFS